PTALTVATARGRLAAGQAGVQILPRSSGGANAVQFPHVLRAHSSQNPRRTLLHPSPTSGLLRPAGVTLLAAQLLAPEALAQARPAARAVAQRPVPAGPLTRVSPSLFANLQYRNVGPARGGRVTTVTGVPQEPHTFYMGSTGGGVWRTTDAGQTWHNISDKYFKVGSMGDI